MAENDLSWRPWQMLAPPAARRTTLDTTDYIRASMSHKKGTQGTRKADTLLGDSRDNTIRGRQGNDTATVGGGDDTFVFERSFAENGLDTITDYSWSDNGGAEQDILDLTAALKAFKKALQSDPQTDIADYVWLEQTEGGVKLMVDLDGSGAQPSQQWALLSGLTAADQVRIRAFTASGSASGSGSGANLGDGYFTLGGEAKAQRIFVTAEFDVDGVNSGGLTFSENGGSAFFDLDDDGILDAAEITSSNKATFGPDGNVDFGQGSFVVEFIGTGKALNATFPTVNLDGFTEDDSIVVNFSQGWATGAGLNSSAIAILQRGRESASSFKFGGYTFSSYTNRSTIGDSIYKVLRQQFFYGPTSGTTNSSRKLGVGVAGINNSGGFLLAEFSNFKKFYSGSVSTSNLIPGQTRKLVGPSLLAAWNVSNTFINLDS